MLPEPRRDAAGRRLYGPGAVHLIEILLHLKTTGMPLARIAEFTRYVASDPDGVPERLALLREHRDHVHGVIDAWLTSLAVIDRKIADYEARRSRGEAAHGGVEGAPAAPSAVMPPTASPPGVHPAGQ